MLIKNAHIVDFDKELQADILIKNGRIEKIGTGFRDEEVIDCSGKMVMPGLIDLNVRIHDDKINSSNLKKCIDESRKGGVTTIALVPDSEPPICNEIALDFICSQQTNDEIVPVVLALQDEDKLSEISVLFKHGAKGIYTTSDINPYLMARVFEYAKMLQVPIFIEPKNSVFRDVGVMNEGRVSFELGLGGIDKLEEIAEVAKIIEYSEHYGVGVLFKNVSTAKSLERIAKSRKCFAEVSIHHLLLNDESCKEYNTLAKISPPLREEEEREALVKALQAGKIDLLTSLHSPKSNVHKDISFDEAAFGISSISYYLPLLYTKLVKSNIIKVTKFAELTSANPACFIEKKVGQITPGYEADLVIFDPNAKTKVDVPTLYEEELDGKVEAVIKKGSLIEL
ncbi:MULTISPECIES: metal-dependent hydrolase [unclassified Nitratiruptor]|uniref:metal-dependent hydrolase n=1 Tax=unclassified Nitratiruptor TaxID=2624044 RepID=UPI0019169220|nr:MULTISPECIES: metal-dependent hydrolase [unclassified Nitratiruptor]BCD60162.1 dihydroorotase [Nitratiruptor sp. YY08-10]BCD64349.1 dihydroorotase [Nitratiruptor sp. YY08-14]